MNQDALAIGTALAARHAQPTKPDRSLTLLNYSERPRTGDWSMRAALTRYSLPHAVSASEILKVIRRLDAVLQHVAKNLETHTVVCDRSLAFDALGESPIDPYPDTRCADLAQLQAVRPNDFDAILAAYETAAGELDDTERSALPLLGVALALDGLAQTLTEWAHRGRHNPPVDAVDAACASATSRLDELGVPLEEGPPRGRGRRGRGT